LTTSRDGTMTGVRPQRGRQEMFLASSADIAIYGGAAGGGKTFALLMEPLYHISNPNFGAVIFRQSYPQIMNEGGLWDESFEIYPHVRPTPSPKTGTLEWVFRSGARVSFRHMGREATKIDYQGAQIPMIGWDQLEQFTAGQFFFMLSRNRSTCGVRPYIRGTANPQPGWLAEFLDWWIAEDGYARLDRIGKVRHFIRAGDSIMWGDAAADLQETYNGERVEPKSVCFIPASIYDNPALLRKDPGYLSNLMALGEVDRLRLLGDRERGGNWRVRESGKKFKRSWFEVVDCAPASYDALVRFWDMAATEAKKGTDPDWTVGALVGIKDGIWYIVDVRRDRATPHNTERLVRATAMEDGYGVTVRMEEEGGSSGKSMIDNYARKVLIGFDFAGVRSTGSKEVRANPVSAAAEAGNVRVVRGKWNGAMLDEIAAFSPDCSHDDQVDAISGAVGVIAQGMGGHISVLRREPGSIGQMDAQIDELIAGMTPAERVEADALLDLA